jgi:hypothetical protein
MMKNSERATGAEEAVSLAADGMSVKDDTKYSSCSNTSSSSPDIADLPGGCQDDFDPIELGDFCDMNTDSRGSTTGGFEAPGSSIEVTGEYPGAGANRTRGHTQARAPLSRREARLLCNRLTGFDLHLERDVVLTGAPLRRDHGDVLGYTRRPTVMRARSSFDNDLEQGRIGGERQGAGIVHISLRAVHNRSIGQHIVASFAQDPALEGTTSALLECAQLLQG